MFFHLTHKIPNVHFGLACSGGIDSMVVLDFLTRYPNNSFEVLHFNHGTTHGQEAEIFVKECCEKIGKSVKIGRISREKNSKESQEEYWRKERYNFFGKFDFPIITCHHLDDCVETWILSSLNGCSKLIPIVRDNYIRPFLMVSKDDIKVYQERHKVDFIQDMSNFENEHSRNIVRNEMMKYVLMVNPGIRKTIKKKILKIMDA